MATQATQAQVLAALSAERTMQRVQKIDLDVLNIDVKKSQLSVGDLGAVTRTHGLGEIPGTPQVEPRARHKPGTHAARLTPNVGDVSQ